MAGNRHDGECLRLWAWRGVEAGVLMSEGTARVWNAHKTRIREGHNSYAERAQTVLIPIAQKTPVSTLASDNFELQVHRRCL